MTDSIWLAEMDTDNYSFRAIGHSREQAMQNLAASFDKHMQRVDAPDWFDRWNEMEPPVEFYGANAYEFGGETSILGYRDDTVVLRDDPPAPKR